MKFTQVKVEQNIYGLSVMRTLRHWVKETQDNSVFYAEAYNIHG